jgi:tetratricopeptide (TPR) repeat protein
LNVKIKVGLWTLVAVGAMSLAACASKGVGQTSQDLSVAAPAYQLTPEQSRLYDHYFLEAMVQRQKGNNDAAFDLLRHCQTINPNAAETYYFLAQYYGAMKQTDQSLDYFKKAAQLNPENETYMETLAQVYIRQQKFQDAIAVVERLYDRNKDREDLLEMLFQLYQQENDLKKAIGVLERIESIDGKNERLSMAKSEVYTRMGDEKAAVAEMAALAKQYPNDLNYLAMYGESLMMNGQTKQALEIYDRILNEEPNNNRVLMSLRTYYQAEENQEMVDSLTWRVLLGKNTSQDEKVYLLRQIISANERAGGDSTEVLQLFRQVMAIDTTDVDMALLCATYMDLKKMPSDSIKPVLNHILKLAPDNSAARLHLVGYAWSEDDKDRVIELCQAAREYNPDDMAFYYYQGIAYYQRDSLDQALSTFQNGVSIINEESNPDIVADFYEVMGEILHKKGRAEEAFAAYDSCLQWKPDNMPCLNNYAYYLSLRDEQLEKAEQMSHKTIKAEPKNATYLDTFAWILFMQKRYAEAKIYIDQALQNMDSITVGGDTIGNAAIYEHAGDIYWYCEDPDKALVYWKDALKGDTENKVLIRKVKLKKYFKE